MKGRRKQKEDIQQSNPDILEILELEISSFMWNRRDLQEKVMTFAIKNLMLVVVTWNGRQKDVSY